MLIDRLLIGFMKGLLGVTARWESAPDLTRQRIYYANHTSHADTLAIISALPDGARANVRPIAAADYWGKNRFLSFFSQKVLNAVLIDRKPAPGSDALAPVIEALKAGDSIIFFPEGTRSNQPLPSDFKSGLHRLSQMCPDVDLVPVYLENLHRSLPKGKHFPLPIICTIKIGDPIARVENEERSAFSNRAREAIVRLSK